MQGLILLVGGRGGGALPPCGINCPLPLWTFYPLCKFGTNYFPLRAVRWSWDIEIKVELDWKMEN